MLHAVNLFRSKCSLVFNITSKQRGSKLERPGSPVHSELPPFKGLRPFDFFDFDHFPADLDALIMELD